MAKDNLIHFPSTPSMAPPAQESNQETAVQQQPEVGENILSVFLSRDTEKNSFFVLMILPEMTSKVDTFHEM